MLGSARAEALSYSAVKLFLKYSNLCENLKKNIPQRHGRTDDILWHHRALQRVARKKIDAGDVTSKLPVNLCVFVCRLETSSTRRRGRQRTRCSFAHDLWLRPSERLSGRWQTCVIMSLIDFQRRWLAAQWLFHTTALAHWHQRVSQKSKPAYCCNNFLYCQPTFIILGTYTV